MDIRAMTASDYGAASALWRTVPGMGLNDCDDGAPGIARFLARNPDTCFVAAEDGRLIGTILCGSDGRRGYIYHLAVDEAYRKRGVGRALVHRGEAALREMGIRKAALVAFSSNEAGNAFWEALGYAQRDDLCYRNRVLDA